MVGGNGARKALHRGGALAVALVIALVLGVEAAMPDFPSTSPASMAFFAALAVATIANLVAAAAGVVAKVPAQIPANRWMYVYVISRLSFAWAAFVLVVVAIGGSIIDHGLARPLFHTLIVEIMLAALWFTATSAFAISALIWTRGR